MTKEGKVGLGDENKAIQPREDAHGGGASSPTRASIATRRFRSRFIRWWVGHQLHCMHPRRRREIGFMPASARFAARVSKVEERPEGAHDVAQRHARSQVTAVQQVLEAGKQLQKCV